MLKVDWAATKKLGKVVYHLNESRNGCNYRFKWRRPRHAMIPYTFAYMFDPVRRKHRELPALLKAYPKLDYFE